MRAVTHLEKVITGEVSAVTHLEKVIAEEASPVTYTEKVIAGEATPITHLQKVIAGVASPVTHLEQVWAGGSPTPSEHEYTGAVPVTITANGQPLLDYTIYGNTVQSGTPSPDNPIIPQGTGERTGNLCPNTGWRSGQYRDGVWETTNTRSTSDFFPVSSNQYRFKINAGQLISFINFNYFDNQKQWLGNRTSLGMSTFSPTAQNIVIPQLPSNAAYMSITIRFYNDNGNPPIPQSFIDDSNIMVSEGTSEPSYEPYGYKIPISSAGQTNNIYIGSEPLRKAVDGSEAVDSLNYSTQQFIRRVDSSGNALAEAVTVTLEVPEIPTVEGQNTIDVLTDVKPSQVYIKYQG